MLLHDFRNDEAVEATGDEEMLPSSHTSVRPSTDKSAPDSRPRALRACRFGTMGRSPFSILCCSTEVWAPSR